MDFKRLVCPLLKYRPNPASFCLFFPFSQYNGKYSPKFHYKSVDGVLVFEPWKPLDGRRRHIHLELWGALEWPTFIFKLFFCIGLAYFMYYVFLYCLST